MDKRIKIMRVFWSVLVIISLSGCFSKSEKELALEAENATQQGSFKAAELILKSGMQEYPDSNRLRYMLSKLYLQTGRGDFAEGHLKKLIDYNYKLTEITPLYLDSLLLQSKYDDVLLSDFSSGNYVNKMIIAAALAGEIEILRKLAKQVVDAKYKQLSNFMLATMDTSSSLPFEKQKFFDFKLGDSNQPHLLLYQSIVAERIGEHEQGLDFIKNYEKFSKVNLYASILKARLLVQAGLLDEAEGLADTLGGVAPNNNYVNYLRGYVYFSQGLYEKAISVLSNINPAGVDTTSFYLIKGLSAYMLERYESAHRSLSKLKGKLPPDHPGLKVLMLTELNIGDTEAAANTILSSDALESDSIGIMIKMLGDRTVSNETKQLLQKNVIQYTETNNSSEALLARFFLANEDVEEKLIKRFEQDRKRSKNAYSLIYYYLSTSQIDKAIGYAKKWAEFDQVSYLPLNMLGKLYQINKNTALSEEAYRQSLKKEENVLAYVGLGDVSILTNDIEDARKNYLSAIQIDSPAPFILKRLFLLSSIAPSPSDLEVFENAAQSFPNNFEINLLYARFLSMSGSYQKSLDVFDEIRPPLNGNKDLYYAEKEKVLKKLLRREELEALYNTWLADEPNSISAWIKAIAFNAKYSKTKTLDLLARLNNQNFKKSIKSALKSEALFKLGEYKNSLQALEDSNNTDVFYLYQTTKIYYELGRYEQAQSQAQALYNEVESDYSALMVAQSLERQGQRSKATEFLQQNFEKNPRHKSATFKLANILLKDDPDSSMIMLTELNKAYPRDPFILNNLAWMLLQKGKLQEAKIKSAEALKVFPTNPFIIHTASQVAQAMENYSLALELVNLALSFLPDNKSMIATKTELLELTK